VAHLCGALSGLTIGLVVLKNFEQKLFEQMLWWIALGIYLACVIFAILFNIINTVNITKLREESMTEHHNY
jgi:rhomboid-related protein 1/2/3